MPENATEREGQATNIRIKSQYRYYHIIHNLHTIFLFILYIVHYARKCYRKRRASNKYWN